MNSPRPNPRRTRRRLQAHDSFVAAISGAAVSGGLIAVVATFSRADAEVAAFALRENTVRKIDRTTFATAGAPSDILARQHRAIDFFEERSFADLAGLERSVPTLIGRRKNVDTCIPRIDRSRIRRRAGIITHRHRGLAATNEKAG